MTAPRELGRVPAGGTAPTRLTVNGTEVELAVPARVTLADVLREELGLTGTHLGCEHGVCGMCTVLVDGDAVRSCLMFACQADGAQVTTVEGLGSPGGLHPLQEAFGRRHALQCGFCTPGFLMSSLDLLTRQPQVEPGDLPAELSGVLCRCTGYRNIVAAVAEVADRYPGGVPPPLNCGPRALPGRRGAGRVAGPAATLPQQPAGAEQPGAPAEGGAVQSGAVGGSDVQGSDVARRHPGRISLPAGEPTIAVELTRQLQATPAEVARVFADLHGLARCLPGAELTAELGEAWYRGRARVALGPVRLSFEGVAHVLEQRDDQVRVLAEGGDPVSGQAQADISLTAAPLDGGTVLSARARLYLVGRIAGFGRSLGGDVATRMFADFARAIERAAAGQAPAASRPPGTIRLVLAAITGRIGRAVRGRRWPAG